MDPIAAEIAREQRYFDEALDHREEFRYNLKRAPQAAATSGAAAQLFDTVDRALAHLRGPEEAVAFGRIDSDDDEQYYVGYNAIWDGNNDILVVNWQAPVAQPYFKATIADPLGLIRRRDFDVTDLNKIANFSDLVFADLAGRVADLERGPSDALLDDLERTRTGEMQDIVRTIQAAQFSVISDDPDQLLVVQGGPGTGKTAIALHRVSWLLFNHRDRIKPEDVLIIGPNRTFVRYIKGVLPSLGDQDVAQIPLTELAPDVVTGRREPDLLVRLKGEARMMGLIDRGLADRVGLPVQHDGSQAPLEVPVGSSTMKFEHDAVDAQLARLAGRPYAIGRQLLRDWFRQTVQERVRQVPAANALDSLIDRIWPQLTAPAFVQELFGSEARLLKAAGDEFTAREVRLLHRKASDRLSEEQWSIADLPLLDYAEYAMTGQVKRRFRHIVVDEAQDLSPMQLRSIARRSQNGAMTVLGDLAQSTGQWARSSWDDVIAELQGALPANVSELTLGYRVPRQIFEFAAQLLPIAAPGVEAPRVVRDGPEDPRLLQVDADDVAAEAVAQARDYASRGLSVAVVCPAASWEAVIRRFQRDGANWRDAARDGIGAGINMLAPADAKGLEFDAVVVVEPEEIVRESDHGTRLLYIALTRTTKFLSVVHTGVALPLGDASAGDSVSSVAVESEAVSDDQAEEVPAEAGSPGPETAHVAVATPTPVQPRIVGLLASSIAEEIKGSIAPELWGALLEEIGRQLES